MRKIVIGVADVVCQLGLIIATVVAFQVGREMGGGAWGLLIAALTFVFGVIMTAGLLCLIEIAENSAQMLDLLRRVHSDVSEPQGVVVAAAPPSWPALAGIPAYVWVLVVMFTIILLIVFIK